MGSVQIFVGCIDDEDRTNSIIRNGKTCAMTGFNYIDAQKGYEIWTNYTCKFATCENIGMQAMIDKIKRESPIKRKIVMAVSELGDILDSCGSTQNEILFINGFLRQLGKIGGNEGSITFRGDLQRFNDLHKRFRLHTSNILIPAKYHYKLIGGKVVIEQNDMCNSSKCQKKHVIKVYSHKPFYEKPVQMFYADRIGQQYDTYQIIKDTLKIPTKKELEQMEREETENKGSFLS